MSGRADVSYDHRIVAQHRLDTIDTVVLELTNRTVHLHVVSMVPHGRLHARDTESC